MLMGDCNARSGCNKDFTDDDLDKWLPGVDMSQLNSEDININN